MRVPAPRLCVALRRLSLALAGFALASSVQAQPGPTPIAQQSPPHSTPVPRYAQARALLKAQVSFTWRYPEGANARPCQGRSKCRVGADANGALGAGPAFPRLVRDGPNSQGHAYWVRPRQLVDLLPGTRVHSVPYSIGGQDLATRFAARLEGYAKGSAGTPPPIGHIGEGLEWQQDTAAGGWHEDRANCPLGIDCSALDARVNNLRIRSTGAMVRPRTMTGRDGHLYAVPTGPDRACPSPVRSINDLRPGDILLRNGHVVIFDGFTTIARAAGRSRAMVVFEATSRCGAVCQSTYDPTYFAGWWMLRLDRDGSGANCPDWLEGKLPPTAPSRTRGLPQPK